MNPNDGPEEPDLHEGFMWKEGHIAKTWKRRFFVVERGVLEYFENMEGGTALGRILLGNAVQRPTKRERDIGPQARAASEAWRLDTDCKQCLTNKAKMHEKYVFAGENDQEGEEWKAAIDKHIAYATALLPPGERAPQAAAAAEPSLPKVPSLGLQGRSPSEIAAQKQSEAEAAAEKAAAAAEKLAKKAADEKKAAEKAAAQKQLRAAEQEAAEAVAAAKATHDEQVAEIDKLEKEGLVLTAPEGPGRAIVASATSAGGEGRREMTIECRGRSLRVGVPKAVAAGGQFKMKVPAAFLQAERDRLAAELKEATARAEKRLNELKAIIDPPKPEPAPAGPPVKVMGSGIHAPGEGNYTSRGYYTSAANERATQAVHRDVGSEATPRKIVTPEGLVVVLEAAEASSSKQSRARIFRQDGTPVLEMPLEVYEGARDKRLAGLTRAMEAAGLDPAAWEYGGAGRQVWHEQRMSEQQTSESGATPSPRVPTIFTASVHAGYNAGGTPRTPVNGSYAAGANGGAQRASLGGTRTTLGAVPAGRASLGSQPPSSPGVGGVGGVKPLQLQPQPAAAGGAGGAGGGGCTIGYTQQLPSMFAPKPPEPRQLPANYDTYVVAGSAEERGTTHTAHQDVQTHQRVRADELAYGDRAEAMVQAEHKLPPGMAEATLAWVEAKTALEAPGAAEVGAPAPGRRKSRAGLPAVEQLHAMLVSGEMLLKLLDALSPGVTEATTLASPRGGGGGGTPRGGPRMGGFVQFERMQRVEQFLRGAKQLGVPQVNLFEAPALLEAADMNQVVVCLDSLRKICDRDPNAPETPRSRKWKAPAAQAPLLLAQLGNVATPR